MIKGMTGFGSHQVVKGKTRVLVEIKSLNHRYFDISYYLPVGFSSLEDKIRQEVQRYVQRGRVTVSVKILEKPLQKVILNKEVVRAHLRAARAMQKEFHLKNDLTLADLIRLPGAVETKETIIEPEALWPDIQKGLARGMRSLAAMRRREGQSLMKDVSDKLRRMLLQAKKITVRQKNILKEKKKVLSDDEYKSFQKSNDINEELSRLTHYVQEAKNVLSAGTDAGKRLDFIAQEMQRETNTIGSKLQDKVVSNAVIALKSKVEKIREQAQNIE